MGDRENEVCLDRITQGDELGLMGEEKLLMLRLRPREIVGHFGVTTI
jgi:hypothetical protein